MNNIHDTLVAASGLVGFLLPLLISAIKQDGLARVWNAIISFVTCAVAALVTSAAHGSLDATNYLASLMTIFTLAAVSYHQLWGPSNLDNIISGATSFIKGKADGVVVKAGVDQTVYATGTPADPTGDLSGGAGA